MMMILLVVMNMMDDMDGTVGLSKVEALAIVHQRQMRVGIRLESNETVSLDGLGGVGVRAVPQSWGQSPCSGVPNASGSEDGAKVRRWSVRAMVERVGGWVRGMECELLCGPGNVFLFVQHY